MKEFFEDYVKKYRKYFITANTVSNTFLITGPILRELRNPKYKVYRYPGKELPKKRGELKLEDFLESQKILDYIILSKTGDDIIATYPMQLLYIIDPELYDRYRTAPPIDLNKIAKKNTKNRTVDENETKKFFADNEDYVLTDVLYSESLMYYPMLSDILDDDSFEKYIVVYPDSEEDTVPESILELPPEERVREAKKRAISVLFIHKKTGTPLVAPIGTFIIIEPEKALKIWKNFRKISPEEFIKILEKHIG